MWLTVESVYTNWYSYYQWKIIYSFLETNIPLLKSTSLSQVWKRVGHPCSDVSIWGVIGDGEKMNTPTESKEMYWSPTSERGASEKREDEPFSELLQSKKDFTHLEGWERCSRWTWSVLSGYSKSVWECKRQSKSWKGN